MPGRPRRLEFDPRGEILANFHSESVAPKQVLHHLARNVAGSGEHARAEELYLRALAVPSEFDDRATRLFDARIRIDLARLFLDGRLFSEVRDATADRLSAAALFSGINIIYIP